MPETRLVRTTSLIEGALLVGNGCRIVKREKTSGGFVEFSIEVKPNQEQIAAQAHELCASTGVGLAMRELREDVYALTGKKPQRSKQEP
ncbi:MAG: hypothetical protein PHZ19_10385 [Candidatus Thermoplasmatota archaeon]|nr:hypothetical protein [Candidatus Thermoplasmatota archaeon]